MSHRAGRDAVQGFLGTLTNKLYDDCHKLLLHGWSEFEQRRHREMPDLDGWRRAAHSHTVSHHIRERREERERCEEEVHRLPPSRRVLFFDSTYHLRY